MKCISGVVYMLAAVLHVSTEIEEVVKPWAKF